MSHRYAHTQAVVLLMVIAIGSSAMARQARQPAAPAQAPAPAGQGNAGLNIAQMPTPVIGKPYRFSLCLGRLLQPGEVSAPCRTAQTNAAQTVGGTAGNAVVTFRLENGSFLPPGLTLDGFGVISGTTNVDVTKLKVKICAIQLGSYGTNFNCQGKPVGFGKDVIITPPPPPPAPVTPAVPPGGGGGGGAGGVKAILGVTAAVAGGVYGYSALKSASVCTEPSTTNQNACFQGSCSACAAALAEYVPYCDCVEQKHSEAAGVGSACRQAVAAVNEAVRLGCLAPANATLVPKPKPAVRR